MKNTILLIAVAIASLTLGACASKKCCGTGGSCCASSAHGHAHK